MDFGALHVAVPLNLSDLHWFECRTPAFYAYITTEISNGILGLFTNLWVVLLILQGRRTLAAQEIFTLNLGVVEIIHCILSQLLVLNYLVMNIPFINNFSWLVYIFNFIGRSSFQCGMSVERYVAVVHPVVFLKYRRLTYRVTFVIADWLFAVSMTAYSFVKIDFYKLCSFFVVILAIDTFCTVCILRVLRQPGPGQGKRKTEEGNTLKKRASQTVLIIQASVVFNYMPVVIGAVLSSLIPYSAFMCVYRPLGFSFCVMGSFIQPILFLHRAGKLRWPASEQSTRK